LDWDFDPAIDRQARCHRFRLHTRGIGNVGLSCNRSRHDVADIPHFTLRTAEIDGSAGLTCSIS
jgi:hypothetical protein